MSLTITAQGLATGISGTVAGTFNTSNDSVLVVAFSGNSIGGFNPAAPSITDNLGTHLTYTLADYRSRADGSPTVDGQCAIWTAPVTTGSSITVTVTCSHEGAIYWWVLTGPDAVAYIGAHGKAASASANSIAQAYTAQATSGWGFGVTCDWDFKGNETAGAGCTVDATGNIGSQYNYTFLRRTTADDSNGVSNSINVSLPATSTALNWCWIEILPLAVSQDILDPPPFVTFMAPGKGISPNGVWNPWFGAAEGGPQPISMTVTATEGGSTFNGIALTVKVLTNSAVTQNGAHNNRTTITTPNLAITPNATGSIVYGAVFNSNSLTTWTANAGTTLILNQVDATNSIVHGHYRSTSSTTSGSPLTLGASAPTGSTGGIAQAEILNIGGALTEDASSPPSVSVTNAITVTTNTFTPPPGATLVATVTSDSGTVVTMSVVGGTLTWTEVDKANGSGLGYAGVWTARVPGGPTQTINSAGITSGEVLGTGNVSTTSGDQIVSATGIVTSELLGTVVVTTTVNVTPTSIISSEVLGAPSVAATVTILPTGIVTSEQLGSTTVAPGAVTISTTGVTSSEVLGSPTLAQVISATGIVSSEALGTDTISVVVGINPVGIVSAEVLGASTVTPGAVTINDAGIVSAEVLGQPSITSSVTLNPTGITSSEQLGAPTISVVVGINPTGIVSAEQLGSSTITPGSVTINAVGIVSSELLGAGSVSFGAVSTISAVGIISSERLGASSVTPGAATISATGIVSAEALGQIVTTSFYQMQGIPSAEAFGTVNVTVVVGINATGISSAERLGAPSITSTAMVLSQGIVSSEVFGQTTITSTVTVSPKGIVTSEAFGTITITNIGLVINAKGIVSAEQFGQITITTTVTMLPTIIVYTQPNQVEVLTGSAVVTAYTKANQVEAIT